MRKTSLFILLFYMLAAACRPALKIKKTEQLTPKADSTSINNNDSSRANMKDSSGRFDSLARYREAYKKVLSNQIDFNTFSAKVKVDYEAKGGKEDFTAYIRIQRDSLIWLSLRGALGIEGARALITKDSVIVLNMLKKEIIKRSIDFLTEFTKLPFSFTTLQDVIVGNPVFVDSNVVAIATINSNELEILMIGNVFRHLATLNMTDNKILHSSLEDRDAALKRNCDIYFTEFSFAAGVPFPTKRKISISEKARIDVDLDFKSFSFNQPVTFPLPDTKNFKKL